MLEWFYRLMALAAAGFAGQCLHEIRNGEWVDINYVVTPILIAGALIFSIAAGIRLGRQKE